MSLPLFESVRKVEANESEVVRRLKNEINGKDVVLVTGHRRENHGDGFIRICNAIKEIAKKNTTLTIIYPVHLNPNVREPVNELLSDILSPILNYHLKLLANFLTLCIWFSKSYFIPTQ